MTAPPSWSIVGPYPTEQFKGMNILPFSEILPTCGICPGDAVPDRGYTDINDRSFLSIRVISA